MPAPTFGANGNLDELAQAIVDLENAELRPLDDVDLAHGLANHIKPYVDRLLETRGTAAPLDKPQTELETDGKQTLSQRKSNRRHNTGPLPQFDALSATEKARWIFMDRFIPLPRLSEILGLDPSETEFDQRQGALDHVMEHLLALVPAAQAAREGKIIELQQIFASCLLLYRSPLMGQSDGSAKACSLQALRTQFPTYFYRRRKKSNWYEHYAFYTEPMEGTGWVVCDSEPLGCTFRNPQNRLAAYASYWGFPPGCVRLQTATEMIYDRIVCGEATSRNYLAGNYNACSSTSYLNERRKADGQMVYAVQRQHKIVVNGSDGLPHWQTNRRLWPVIHPYFIMKSTYSPHCEHGP